MKFSSDEPTDARVGSDGNNYGAFLNAISWDTKIYENNDVF